VEQRLPPASRGAAGPLGGVMVMGRGRRGGRGRYKLVAEDGGGPLAAHYRRHGGPRPRRRLTAPPIRSSPPTALLAPAGAGDHLARRGPAGTPLPTRRSTAGRGLGLCSREARAGWPDGGGGEPETAALVVRGWGICLLACLVGWVGFDGCDAGWVTSHFVDAAMCVFFSPISQMSFEAFRCWNGMSTQSTRRLVTI
jgi:hypothetical protein